MNRLSVLYRSGRLAIEQADQDEEEDFVGEAEEMCTRLEIRRQLELQAMNNSALGTCFNWSFSKLGGLGKIF